MKRKNEEVPGFDEIVFENRNKEYGAYDLRKRYVATTSLSILVVVALSIALLAILSFTMERKSSAKTMESIFVIIKPDPSFLDPNKIKQPEPEKPKPEIFKPVYIEPVVVDKVDSTDNVLVATGSQDSVKNRPVDAIIVPDADAGPVIPDEPAPSVIVEEMPTFPGGTEALLKFISETIKYPEEAAINGIQGRVILRFVVSSDGSVKQVEVLRSIHPSLDQEAIRVVSALPKWKPGKQNGRAVPVFYSVPVNFKLKYN